MLAQVEYCQELEAMALGYGIVVSDEQAMLILRHIDLVVEKNQYLNLTRVVEDRDALVLHALDSLLFLKGIDETMRQQLRLLDIGTGAGFPGIPLSVMTGYETVLADSVGKKITAVNEFIEVLGLEHCHTFCGRVEELARKEHGTYNNVVARAVAKTSAIIEYATPLLTNKGLLIVSKGQLSEEEISSAEKTSEICGLSLVSRETLELPYEYGHREILTYKKTRGSKVKLPRQSGAAVHKPLV